MNCLIEHELNYHVGDSMHATTISCTHVNKIALDLLRG